MEAGEKVAIGFAASEKQGIDAALESLAATDSRFWNRADRYWNARGGSYTDGGAFFFSVSPNGKGMDIHCTDKFGLPVPVPTSTPAYRTNGVAQSPSTLDIPLLSAQEQFDWFKRQVVNWDYAQLISFLKGLEYIAQGDGDWGKTIDVLTLMMDRRIDTGNLRRSSLLSLVDTTFANTIEAIKTADQDDFIFHAAGKPSPERNGADQTVVIDARGYTPQDETSLAREIQRLYTAGFRRFLIVHAKGHRFIGNGLGANTQEVRIDVYGSPGDYAASGLDGMELHLHNHGQDQLAQIMKAGKLVVHGDVGQTFMYAAKGGDVYVLGNTAGRPLINAVGKPRVVINGTCLDYLAESFMAGDPLEGGGFVVLNGLTYNEGGELVDLDTPYPGGNLFSLASGGAIYLRDPHGVVGDEQLNGGEFTPLTPEDWALIEPYLQENARLFDIPMDRLLSVDGEKRGPSQVYRKIKPRAIRALQAEEAWVTESRK